MTHILIIRRTNEPQSMIKTIVSFCLLVLICLPIAVISEAYQCTKPFSITKEIQIIESKYKRLFHGSMPFDYNCGKPVTLKEEYETDKNWILKEAKKWL
jgi:hypothetical protein